tara:strand:+ start:226 stop:591 length:366 start_codon:yes stop_codon:yes gene_type:complete
MSYDTKFSSVVEKAVYELTNEYLHFRYDNSGTVTFFNDLSSNPSQEAITKKTDELNALLPLQELRIERNRLLAESDWTQVLDVSLSNIDEWKVYRKALRDLPETAKPVLVDSRIDYPIKPV